jgi:flagellar motor switch protein FliG
MNNNETMVLTMYGKGNVAETVSVARFEKREAAINYIESIESRPLAEGWASCDIIEDFRGYELARKKVYIFENTILRLSDREIQKVLRETDTQELSTALRDTNEDVKKAFFRNMSKRAAEMLQEDMEFMGPARKIEIQDSRKKICATIQRLEATGDIESPDNPLIQ